MQESSSPIRTFLECVLQQRNSLLRFSAIDETYWLAHEPRQYRRTPWHRRPTARAKTRDRSAKSVQRLLDGKKCKPRKRVELAFIVYRPLKVVADALEKAEGWIEGRPRRYAELFACILELYESHRSFLGRMRDSGKQLQSEDEAWIAAFEKVVRTLARLENTGRVTLPERRLFTFVVPDTAEADGGQDREVVPPRILDAAELLEALTDAPADATPATSPGASGREPPVEGAEWIDKGILRKIMGLRIPQDLTKRIKDGTILREINGTKLGIRHHRIQVVSAQLAKLREERLRLEEQWRREKELGK